MKVCLPLITQHLNLNLYMNNWLPFFTSLLVAAWAVAVAVLSAQNVTRVSLQFLGFQSIQLPVGIVLTISVGVGLVGGGIARGLWRRQKALG
jgi:uncharacterized integral membrane protein